MAYIFMFYEKNVFAWRLLSADARFGPHQYTVNSFCLSDAFIEKTMSKRIGSHKPTHVVYSTRANLYTSEHRSPSEHLIKSNDEY